MRRVVLGIGLIFAVGLAGACSSSAGGAAVSPQPTSAVSSSTASGAAAASGTPTTSSASASGPVGPLTYTPETSATASGLVTPDKGGTITATATDGTTYTLSLVPNQVSKPVTISLVPLDNVGGIPSDHPISAVKMLPSGQTFNGPAELTIVPAQPLPPATQAMFLTDDAGNSLGMAVVNVTSKPLTMQVPHFTIAAAASLTPGTAAAVAVTNFQNVADQLRAQVAAVLGQGRQEQLLGVDSTSVPPALTDEFSKVEAALQDALSKNIDNCDVAEQLIAEVLSMERQRKFLGMTSSTTPPLSNADIARIYKACEKKAIKKCQDADDPSVLIGFWLGVMHQQSLSGVQSTTLPDGSEPTTDRALRLCVSFDMTGEVGPVTFQGHVDDIRKPWDVQVSSPGASGTATVTPSSARGGKIHGTSQGSGLTIETTGSYTLTKTDTGYTGKGTAKSCITSTGSCSPTGLVRLTFTRPSE